MKSNNRKALLIGLLLTSVLLCSFIATNKTQQRQTEKYALVYVEDRGKVKTISISKSGEEISISTLKVSEKADYTGVANALVELNKEGYTLVSSSVAGMNGYLFYSYTLKKLI